MAKDQGQIHEPNDLDLQTEIAKYLRHLPRHLHNLEQYAQLHELIDYSWMAMRREQARGSYAEFLEDIDLAINSPIENPTKWLTLQVRYGLIKSSIRSLATNVPPILYPLLVDHGFWTLSQATSFAVNIEDPEARCEALFRLSQMPRLNVGDKETLFTEILNMHWSPADIDLQSWALRSIAPYLPQSMLSKAIKIAEQIQPNKARFISLSGLIPFLPEDQRSILLGELLDDARQLNSPQDRASLLAYLAPLMDNELLLEVLREIEDIQPSEFSQRTALAQIAGFLPARLHDYAIRIMDTLEDCQFKIEVLVALAERKVMVFHLFKRYELETIPPYFHLEPIPESLKIEELNMARKIVDSIAPSDVDERIQCLLVLALSSLQLTQADHEFVLSQIGKFSVHHRIFENFYSRFSSGEKEAAICRLLELKMQGKILSFLEACSEVAPYLEPQFAFQLFEAVAELYESDKVRTHQHQAYNNALGALIQRVAVPHQERWLDKYLPHLMTIGDTQIRELTVSEFAKQSGHVDIFSVKERADLFGIQTVQDECTSIINLLRVNSGRLLDYDFLNALHEFIPYFTIEQFSELLQLVKKNEVEYGDFTHNHGAYLCGNLGPYLTSEMRFILADFISERAGCYCYRGALFDLVEYLDNYQLSQLLLKVNTLENNQGRELALVGLVPYLSEEFTSRLIQAATLGIATGSSLQKLIINGHRREHRDFAAAFRFAETRQNDDFDRIMLCWLPYLSREHLKQAIKSSFNVVLAHGHWGPFPEGYPCMRVAPYLPIDLFLVMLELFGHHQSDSRDAVIRTFAKRIVSEHDIDRLNVWSQVIRVLAHSSRSAFLQGLAVLAEFIGTTAGIQSQQEIIDQILDIATWWN